MKNIVTHEYADTMRKLDEVPSFRFENLRFDKHLETSERKTIAGQVINRIYVENLEWPKALNREHRCVFIVDIPYYNIFQKMYQERFAGSAPAVFDTLSKDHIIAWTMKTYNIKVGKAKKLLDYFRYSLLKMLYNPLEVNKFLTEKVSEPYFESYTYDTVYKYLTGDVSVTTNDYIKALYKYRMSKTAITEWLKKKLEKDEENLVTARLLAWLPGKADVDLLIFAKGK